LRENGNIQEKANTLWMGLPECYDEIRISEYRLKTFEYVYMICKNIA